MTTEKKIPQDLENSQNFCDFVIHIFTERKSHGTGVQGAIKQGKLNRCQSLFFSLHLLPLLFLKFINF
jgi:hypothetical protein